MEIKTGIIQPFFDKSDTVWDYKEIDIDWNAISANLTLEPPNWTVEDFYPNWTFEDFYVEFEAIEPFEKFDITFEPIEPFDFTLK